MLGTHKPQQQATSTRQDTRSRGRSFTFTFIIRLDDIPYPEIFGGMECFYEDGIAWLVTASYGKGGARTTYAGNIANCSGGPAVSYLWPIRTELSRRVSETRTFLSPNISVISGGSCLVTEVQIASFPSKKEFFALPHFCDLCRSCAKHGNRF